MKNWLFVLGRQPTIGLAELLSVLSLEQVRYEARLFSPNTVLIATTSDFDLAKLLTRLGGTIKIAIVDEVKPRVGDSRQTLSELLKPDEVVSCYSKKNEGR